jgi:AAHS family benzoate transporter-like MFS transporter
MPLTEAQQFNLDDCLRVLNDKGLYQIRTLLILGFVWGIAPIVAVLLPFFILEPVFLCRNLDDFSEEIRLCTHETLCSPDFEYFLSPNNVVKTWTYDFDLMCHYRYLVYLIGSVSFFGMIVANITAPKFCETYGRKPVLLFNIVLFIVINLLVLFIRNNKFLILYSFICGVVYTGIAIPAFVLNFEYITRESKNTWSSILNAGFPGSALIQICFFYFFRSWMVSVLVCLAFFISTLILSPTILESPSFLMMMNKREQLLANLKTVSKVNRTEGPLDAFLEKYSLDDIPHIDPASRPSMFELFTNSDNRLRMFLIGVSWYCNSLITYGTFFNIKKYGSDIVVNGITIHSSGTVSILLSSIILNKFGQNKAMTIYFTVAMVANLLMSIFSGMNNQVMYFLLFISGFCTAAIGNINYIYTADLFQDQLRVTAVSTGSLINRIAGICSPWVVGAFDRATYPFTFACFLSLISMIYLKRLENRKKAPACGV